jgi:signal transduction histidine kinase
MHRAVIGGRPRIVEELGLARALQVTVVAFAADGGLRSSFEQTGVARKSVPAPVESALYRIAQEAMTNVMKHAPDARNLSAVLSFSNEAVSLTISDDGPGFAPQPSPHNGRDEGGTGLRGMQHRMRDVGGTLTIETHPGGGTTILASVPLAPEPERAGGS